MKRMLLPLLALGALTSHAQNLPSTNVYTYKPAPEDTLKPRIIMVDRKDPFALQLQLAPTQALEKATVSYNRSSAPIDFTSNVNRSFTITDFSSITIELQIGDTMYDKAKPVVYTKLKWNDGKDSANVSPGTEAQFLRSQNITDYAASRVEKPMEGTVMKVRDSKTYKLEFTNGVATADDSIANSNILVGSLIKTLAGARPQDELIDLFLKLNFGRRKQMFALVGADAGIGSNRDDSSSGLFRINEAMASFNWAFYTRSKYRIQIRSLTEQIKQQEKSLKTKTKGTDKDSGRQFSADARYVDTLRSLRDSFRMATMHEFDRTLKRTFFVGAGLKIFNSVPYVGGHFGSIEINGPLFSSYLLAGYYYSPYLKQVISRDSLVYNSYRHNVYIEAALNAFGSKVPSLLRTVRLKFGVMLPIKGGGKDKDEFRPESRDVISRLSIEVPLGGPFRF